MNPGYLRFFWDFSVFWEKVSSFDPDFSNDGEGSDEQIEREEDGSVATVEKEEIKRPSLYKVFLHNDDYTTMDFVVFIPAEIFSKNYRRGTKNHVGSP